MSGHADIRKLFLCRLLYIFRLLLGALATLLAKLHHLFEWLFAVLSRLAWSITLWAAIVRNYKLCFCHMQRGLYRGC